MIARIRSRFVKCFLSFILMLSVYISIIGVYKQPNPEFTVKSTAAFLSLRPAQHQISEMLL